MTDEATPCSAFVLLLVVGTLAALHDSLDCDDLCLSFGDIIHHMTF